MTSQASPATAAAPSGFEALLAIDPAVLEAIPAAVYLCAAAGVIVRFNRRAAEVWGRTPRVGDTDERFCGSFRLYHLDGTLLPHARTPMATALRTGRPQHGQEVVIERPDGSRVVVLVHIDPLKDRNGEIQGAINCFQDVTERKRVEAALARRLEEQAALHQITDRLHRAESLGDVYDSALDAILRALPCQRASILLFDEAGGMRFVAWRGLSDEYRRAVDGHSPWTPDAKDPQPICIDDVESADLPEPLRATIRAEGIRALAFIPLVTGGKLVGKFMSYYDASHVFTDAEVDLAVAIGRQLGFGVERIRAEQARRIAEEELRASEARERAHAAELQTIMEAVPAVIWIARDPECRVINGNTAS
jgi:PAS domain S-box-containing protein